LGATLRSTPPDTRGGKSISGTQKRRRIQKGICSQKSGGDFFIKKELNKALWGSLSNRLSNMEPYKKAPAGRTGACDTGSICK